MDSATAAILRGRIAPFFEHDLDTPVPDPDFNKLASDVFEFQFETNAPYAAYCRRRAVTPDRVTHWSEIPPVPTAAFKEVTLVSGTPEDAQRVFRTSGTTHGGERRGAHHILDLQLYHEALLPMFAGYVLPDRRKMPFLSLVPYAAQVLDSSLAEMITVAALRLGAPTSRSYLDPKHGILETALEQALDQYTEDERPVLLLGTSFAFVHWLDTLRERNVRFRLPAGSRLMDTGGFKGRSRIVPADELRAAYNDRLGIPAEFCVNEYGMTELCSQFYDTTLRDTLLGRNHSGRRIKRPAPWVRTRVVDPETLQPAAEGELGILQHYDLANLHSVMAVQTEDVGRLVDDGFVTLGRAEGATPRGCSIAVDLLLDAVRQQR
jgi:Acyl-protein synthetase, LuxE